MTVRYNERSLPFSCLCARVSVYVLNLFSEVRWHYYRQALVYDLQDTDILSEYPRSKLHSDPKHKSEYNPQNNAQL